MSLLRNPTSQPFRGKSAKRNDQPGNPSSPHDSNILTLKIKKTNKTHKYVHLFNQNLGSASSPMGFPNVHFYLRLLSQFSQRKQMKR